MIDTPEFRNLVREFVYTTFHRPDLDLNGALKTVVDAMDTYDVSPLQVSNSFRRFSPEFLDKFKLEPKDVANLTSVFGNLDVVMQAYDSVAVSGRFHSSTWQPDRSWLLDLPETKTVTVPRITSSPPGPVSATDSTPAPSPISTPVPIPVVDPLPAPVIVQPTPVVDKDSAVIRLLEKPGYWLGDLFVFDLNQDGVDEVIVAGRLSQPASAAEWLGSYVSVLGFNTGAWSNETRRWFGTEDVKILGTEPSVRLGDFDGDGRNDIWVAPSTDMEHYGPGVVFFNNGDELVRHDLDIGKVWAHDSEVADINGDGFDDIITGSYGPDQTLAFGSPDRTFTLQTTTAIHNYAGITASDFLNDGSISVVMVDTWGDGVSDTALYRFSSPDVYTGLSNGEIFSNQNFDFVKATVLPADGFVDEKWAQMPWLQEPGRMPHSVRATAFDFNLDGLDDVLVHTSANNANNDWHSYFDLQFLENLGNGKFVDRSDEVLVNWDAFTTVSYNPVIRDINGDGLVDIWLSSQDYQGIENSNRVLFAQDDGTFMQAWQQELSEMRVDLGGNPSPVVWLQGPDASYLASMIWSERSEFAEVKLIGEIPL